MGHLIVVEKWAENLEEVTLHRWLKRKGEHVREGDLLCEIITDKVTFEYEVEVPGYILRTFCPDKSVLPVGYAIAFVGEQGENAPPGIEARNRELLQKHSARSGLHLDLEGPDTAGTEAPRRQRERLEPRVRATPAARRVARENEVSIEEVAAWAQHGGPVSQSDVETYIEEMDDDE